MLSNEKVLDLIRKIESDTYQVHELNNLYKNAVDNGYYQVQLAVQDALRRIGGSKYTKKFLQPIRTEVENLVYQLAEQHSWLDFSNNQVRNGIKVGGGMMNGSAIAQYYFSYKEKGWKRSVSFSATQEDEKSEIYYLVGSRNFKEEVRFSTAEEALELFKNEIAV